MRNIAYLAITAVGEGVVIGARPMSGNPYSGHSLALQIEHVENFTEVLLKQAIGDRCCRDAELPNGCEMHVIGQRHCVCAIHKRRIKWRSAIEPHIVHMNYDWLLGHRHLKDPGCDAMHAVHVPRETTCACFCDDSGLD